MTYCLFWRKGVCLLKAVEISLIVIYLFSSPQVHLKYLSFITDKKWNDASLLKAKKKGLLI